MSAPMLSVVVTIVDGGAALRTCLQALRQQSDPPPMEVLVPFDDTVSGIEFLRKDFPAVRFLPLGRIQFSGGTDPTTEHQLYDRRRAAGLAAAQGQFIAILEDRGKPAPDWARTVIDLHLQGEWAAIGGAIENGSKHVRLWAIYFCDFGRFQPPLQDSSPEYVSDVNICYSRAALESVRDLWSDVYQEPTVNWALRRKGYKLLLSDKARVIQECRPRSFSTLLRERWHWGRIFGRLRGRERSRADCMLLAAACPVLPLWLLFRHARRQLRKGYDLGKFVLAAPAMTTFLIAWSCGELFGYWDTARKKAG